MDERSDDGLRRMLVILFVVYLFNFLDRQIVTILAEPIARDLDLSDTQIGLMTGLAFALLYTVLGLPIARYSDRPQTNRVTIIAVAVAVWSAMTALSGLALNFTQLLLARIGVGIGEAGCTPPAHSLIADKAPPDKRAMAIAVYQLGPPAGILLGMVIGGLLADYLGWRYAFFLVGAPGLLLALVVRALLRDPRFEAPGQAPGLSREAPPAASVADAARHILASRAMIRLLLVAGIGSFAGYGLQIWATIFFQRSHGLTPGETGLTFGVVNGIGMGLAAWLGGYFAQRLGAKDKRRIMTVPALGFFASVPIIALALFVPQTWLSLALFLPGIVASFLYVVPHVSSVQGLVPPSARAVASAVVLFLQNLVGLGLGPLVLGYFSDLLKPEYGEDSVRYVLLIACLAALVAGWLIWSSRRFLPEELDRYS